MNNPNEQSPTPRTEREAMEAFARPGGVQSGIYRQSSLETELAAAQSEIERLKAERDKAKDDFLLAVGNAGACGACAENIACGSSMHDHDDECHITKFRAEIERLTKERDATGQALSETTDNLLRSSRERDELRARVATLEGAAEKATAKLNEWFAAKNPHPGSINEALAALAPHRRASTQHGEPSVDEYKAFVNPRVFNPSP